MFVYFLFIDDNTNQPEPQAEHSLPFLGLLHMFTNKFMHIMQTMFGFAAPYLLCSRQLQWSARTRNGSVCIFPINQVRFSDGINFKQSSIPHAMRASALHAIAKKPRVRKSERAHW